MKDVKFLKRLGKRIKILHLESGLSQQKVASECDFEKSNLSRIESGKTNPTALTLYNIANALHIEISKSYIAVGSKGNMAKSMVVPNLIEF